MTMNPVASPILRICWLRPSTSVTSSQVLPFSRRDHEHLGGTRLLTVDDHAFFPAQAIGLFHLARDLDHVRLRDVALGVDQRIAEFAVVGEEKHAARVIVEPPHRENTLRDPGTSERTVFLPSGSLTVETTPRGLCMTK